MSDTPANYGALFEPVRLGRLTLPNRIAMAPMARFRCLTDGTPDTFVPDYFAQRAGAGLVTGDSVYVDPRGRMTEFLGGMTNDAQQAGWARVVDAVHAAGGRMFLSLIHSGRISHPSLQPDGGLPVAPSAVRVMAKERMEMVTPRALETSEVEGLVESFANAARRAAAAGFDGVEFHCANGYLGAQFLSASINLRTDKYGGSVENRCRFPVEVVTALCREIGADRVGIKVSPGFHMHDDHDPDPRETHAVLLAALQPLGLAYVHAQAPLTVFGLHHDLDYDPVAFVRAHHHGMLLRSGNLDRHSAAEGVRSGAFDVAVFGRRFVANPDLPRRFFLDAPENELDVTTLDCPGPRGYVDYPFLTA